MKDQELLIAEYRMLSTANVSDGLDRIGVDGAPLYGRGFIQQSIRNRCACAGCQIEVKLGEVSVHREI